MSTDSKFSCCIVCLLLVFCILIFWWTRDMTPGAETFPRIMAGGLFAFGIVELILSILRMSSKSKTEVSGKNNEQLGKSVIYMGAFFLLVVAFFLALPHIGFEIAAVIFMLLAMILLGGKSSLRKWPIAFLVPAMLLLVFRFGLDVRLPTLFF